jgi:hypothetical protein
VIFQPEGNQTPRKDQDEEDKSSRVDLYYEEPVAGSKLNNAALEDHGVKRGFIAAVALIYRLYNREDANRIIQKGFKRAIEDFYPETTVIDASYNPKTKSPELAYLNAKATLENDESLTDTQIRLLLEEGEIDPEKIAKHIQQGNTRDSQAPTRNRRDDYRRDKNMAGEEHYRRLRDISGEDNYSEDRDVPEEESEDASST